MKFIIFHGAFGNPDGNWFPELKEKLEFLGQEVICPQFPVDDYGEITKRGLAAKPKHQSLENWLKTFEKEVLPKLKKRDKLCFIGHSLSPVFILHSVDKYNIKLDSAIFVSPFMDRLNNPSLWQFNLVNKTFYKTDFNFEKIKKLIPVSYVLYSSNDPYVNKNHSILFARALDSSTILVKRAGHMNSEVNLNEFPLVYELCKSRLDLSLYQRYLDHRKELFATNYFKGRHEEVVYLSPEEIFDEGLFHFRNLGMRGFCTFPTSTKFWDTQGKYFKEARRAAKRIKNFIRVFIVQKLTDLRRPIILEHINLDLKADMTIYLCAHKKINDLPELDFGLWDNDYLCVVHSKNETPYEVKLSSRKQDIVLAEKWMKLILNNSVKINNTTADIEKFIKIHS